MGSCRGIIAGVAVLGVVVSGCQSVTTRSAQSLRLTAARLAPRAVSGVIASGTIGRKPWRIRVTLAPARSCDQGHGWAADCLEGVGDLVKHWRRDRPRLVSISTFSPVLFGPVRSGVTLVSMRMSNGSVINLRPVEAFGHRWIGVVLPAGLTPTQAHVYAGRTVLTHAVPYVGHRDGSSPEVEFLSWLPPGAQGPPRETKTVHGPGYNLILHAGPWGNVLDNSSEEWSFPLGYHPNGPLGGGGGLPRPAELAFPAAARYVVLKLADGTTRRTRLVLGAGEGFAIVEVPAKPAVLRWDVYDRAGHRLSGGQGPPGQP